MVDHLLAALERLDQRIEEGMRARAREHDLTIRGSEARILHMIGPDGTRPTELAAGAWITKQAITKRIAGLEERGFVRLEPDPDDGRAVRVHLSPSGAQLRELLGVLIADLESELESEVGAERYRAFRDVVDELGSRR